MPELNTQKLTEFLEEQEKLRSEGKTVAGLHDKQDRMLRALEHVVADRLEDKAKLDRHDRAIKTLQRLVEDLTDATPAVPNWKAPKDETATGAHVTALAAIQKKFDDEQKQKLDEETWWRRQRWLWFGVAVTIILGGLITGCVGYVSYRIQAIEKTLSEKR